MDINAITGKLRELAGKYKYALAILLIGIALLFIPGKETKTQVREEPAVSMPDEVFTQESLAQFLQSVDGAGNVKVLLSMATGEETIYQTDADGAVTGENQQQSVSTVIVTDAQRSEMGLVRQVNPAGYKGAVVLCQGADSPAVRLAITQAVSKITGLGTDAICVLKMQ